MVSGADLYWKILSWISIGKPVVLYVEVSLIKYGIVITVVEFQWYLTITVLWMDKVTITHGAGKTKDKIKQECEFNINPFRLTVGVLHSRATWSWNLHCKSGCLVISVHCGGQSHVYSAGSKRFLATGVQEHEKVGVWGSFFPPSLPYIPAEWKGVHIIGFSVCVWQNTHNQDLLFQTIKLLLIRLPKACLCHSFTIIRLQTENCTFGFTAVIVDYVRSLCVWESVCTHINP